MSSTNAINHADPKFMGEIFDYNPDTGILKRKKTGAVAGRKNKPGGHLRTWVLGREVLVHRIAFAIFYGRWPRDQIDHINGNPSDNRISNLREAKNFQNSRNRLAQRNSKTGILGVSWSKAARKFRVQIKANGEIIHIGVFSTVKEAAAARKNAELKYHGEFASSLSRSI